MFKNIITYCSFLLLFCRIGYGQQNCEIHLWNAQQQQYENQGAKSVSYLDSLQQMGYYTLQIDSIQRAPSCRYFVRKGKLYNEIWVEMGKKRWRTNDIDSVIHHLKDSLQNSGYPFAQIQLRPMYSSSGETVARLEIEPGKQRNIDALEIKGYKKFPTFLQAQILSSLRPYNENKIKQVKTRIENTGIAQYAQPAQLAYTPDSTFLFLHLKKRKRSSFDGVLGFNSDEGKLKLSGQVAIDLYNSFNQLEKIYLHWASGDTESQKINLGFETPYIFKTALGLQSDLNIHKQDSTFVKLEWRNGISYYFDTEHKITGNYNLASSNYIQNDSSSSQNLDFSKSGFGLSYQFSTDQPTDFRANKWFLFFMSNLWRRKTDSEEKEQQTELQYNIRRQQRIVSNHYLYAEIWGKNLIQKDDSFINDYYRVGGFGSIRGFNQQSIASPQVNTLSAAYRYIPNANILFELFADQAWVQNPVENKNQSLLGLGLGAQLRMQLGVFSIGYAVGKQEDTSFDFQNAKVHIGLTTRF